MTSATPVNVVIDTDPGVDDFLAIALALNSPEIAIDTFTTTSGNAALRHTNANTLRILEALNRNPRSQRGAAPAGRQFRRCGGRTRGGRAPDNSADAGHTPSERTRRRIPWRGRLKDGPPVALIALGPPTNIARLFRGHPGSAKSVDCVVLMGGAVDVPGNVTSHAEFNMWSDPEATALVFECGVPVTMVGSNVCNRVRAFSGETPKPASAVIQRLTEAQFGAANHPLRSPHSDIGRTAGDRQARTPRHLGGRIQRPGPGTHEPRSRRGDDRCGDRCRR